MHVKAYAYPHVRMCVCIRRGVMEPAGVVGSSMMDSGVWHEALQHRHPPPITPCPPSSVLESGATCELPADSDTCALHAVFLHMYWAG